MHVPLSPPQVVTTGSGLRDLVTELQRHDRLAVDTESNSLHAYQERVCLIQVSTPEADFLIDPLILSDLHPLSPVLADAQIEKVFHAAEYDLACLHRDFGFEVAPIFDTRVAVRTLGHPRTGLGDLLEEAFGVRLDKRHQRANWGKRPLPPSLLDYARLDTHYLLALRDRLAAELEVAGRVDEASEECLRLSRAALVGTPQNGDDPFWKVANARRLNGSQAAVLRELYRMRDQEARRRDCPPFKIMSDSSLMSLAQASPRSRRALERLDSVPSSTRSRHADSILAAVERGLAAPPPSRPSGRGQDEAAQVRFQRLREWRRRVAETRGVESDVILPREVTWEIARTNPRGLEALHDLMAPLETRFQAYGRAILTALDSTDGPTGHTA